MSNPNKEIRELTNIKNIIPYSLSDLENILPYLKILSL